MEDLLVYYLIGGLVYFIILYIIIAGAMNSATKNQTHYLKIQNRLLVKMLRKQGVPRSEIVDAFNNDDDSFWKSITDD